MKEKWLIIGAFFAIYIIWGSTYMVNDWVIKEVPPFLMAGSRFVTAGLLMFIGMLLLPGFKFRWPNWIEIRNAFLLGIVFITIGNGLVVQALAYIDSGMTALLISFDPLLIVLMMWFLQGIRPQKFTVIGVVLGIIGMVLLLNQPLYFEDPQFWRGLIYLFIAMIGWGLATIYLKTINLPDSKGISTAIQMFGGGLVMIIYSLISGEYLDFDAANLTSKGVYGWFYLVFFGSIIAFTSFNYLLYMSTPEKVSSSTFVNPVVALFLGWMFNSEIISGQSLIASCVLLIGVLFIIRNKRSDYNNENDILDDVIDEGMLD